MHCEFESAPMHNTLDGLHVRTVIVYGYAVPPGRVCCDEGRALYKANSETVVCKSWWQW